MIKVGKNHEIIFKKTFIKLLKYCMLIVAFVFIFMGNPFAEKVSADTSVSASSDSVCIVKDGEKMKFYSATCDEYSISVSYHANDFLRSISQYSVFGPGVSKTYVAPGCSILNYSECTFFASVTIYFSESYSEVVYDGVSNVQLIYVPMSYINDSNEWSMNLINTWGGTASTSFTIGNHVAPDISNISIDCSNCGEWKSGTADVSVSGVQPRFGGTISTYEACYTLQLGNSTTEACSHSSTSSYIVVDAPNTYINREMFIKVCTVTNACARATGSKFSVMLDNIKPTIPSEFTITDAVNGYVNKKKLNTSVSGGNDTGSGIARYYVTYMQQGQSFGAYDGKDAPTSIEFDPRADGVYEFVLHVHDYAGNQASTTISASITYDSTAPTGGSLSCNGVCDAWTNESVKISGSGATDSGVDKEDSSKIYYQYKVGENGTFYKGESVNTTEVNSVVYFQVCDSLGNCRDLYSKKVMIDLTAPAGGKMTCDITCDEWTALNKTISFSEAVDAGVGEVYYKIKLSEDGEYIGEYTSTYVIDVDINDVVSVIACDSLGNCQNEPADTKLIKVDKSAPTGGSLICDGVCDSWTKGDVKISGSGATDTGIDREDSSKIYYQYRIGESGSFIMGESVNSAEVDVVVYFQVCDSLGNCGDLGSKNVRIDRSAPINGVVECDSVCGSWTSSNLKVEAKNYVDLGVNSEDSSQIVYKYKVDGYVDWVELKGSASKTWTVEETEGKTINQRIKFKICDTLGNCTDEISRIVMIDNQDPSVSISCDNGVCGVWTNVDVTASAVGEDHGGSGIKSISYSVEGDVIETREKDSYTLRVNEGQQKKVSITFVVVDNAGRIASDSVEIMIDKKAPTLDVLCGEVECDGWFNSNTLVKVYADDEGGVGSDDPSGISFAHKVDNGEESEGDFYTVIAPEGDVKRTEVTFNVCDQLNNCASIKKIVKIDTQVPEISVICNDGVCGRWFTDDVKAVAIGNDLNGSGASNLVYKVTDLVSEYSRNESEFTLAAIDGQIRNAKLVFEVCDLAGNCASSPETTIQIDKMAPAGMTLVCTIPYGESILEIECGSWINETVTVKATGALDIGEGSVIYKYKTGTAGNYTTGNNVSFSNEVITTITFQACDGLGNCNESTITKDIQIDRSAPYLLLGGVNQGGSIEAKINEELSFELIDDKDNEGNDRNIYSGIPSAFNVNYFVSTYALDENGMASLNDIVSFGLLNTADGKIKVMNYSKYYVYIYMLEETAIKDIAGNIVDYTSLCENNIVLTYEIITTGELAEDTTEAIDDLWDTIEAGLSGYTMLEEPAREKGYFKAAKETRVSGLNNIFQLQDNKYLIITLNEHVLAGGVERYEVNDIFDALHLTVKGGVSLDAISTTALMDHILYLNNDKPIVLSIIIIDNTPTVNEGVNLGDSIRIIQGEELGNVGLSFESKNGAPVEVTTEITLDGVKVKKIDTNKAGVYTIRQVAIDSEGRTARSTREVVVEAKVEEKVEEVVAIEVEEIVDAAVEVVEKDIEEQSIIEVKEKVNEEVLLKEIVEFKTYLLEKVKESVSKCIVSFKLFSKYFFKVYGG